MSDTVPMLALLAFMAALAVAMARHRNLFVVTMFSSLFSLMAATLFVLFDAPDVAFTEAAVGSAASTVLLLATLALTGRREKPPVHRRWLPLTVVAVTGAALVYGTLDMPRFGDPEAPVHHHVAPRYIQDSPREIGIPNMVASVLASYRGYDTLGEVVVIFTAGLGVLLLMGGRTGRPEAEDGRPPTAKAAPAGDPGHASRALAPASMDGDVILRVAARILVPFVAFFALYVLAHGKYGPGGGFQAGILLAAALILHGLVFGIHAARRVAGHRTLLGMLAGGVLLYGGVGVLSLVAGRPFLDYSVLPGGGVTAQKIGILAVEIGVTATVAATTLIIYFYFSERMARR